MERTNFQNLVIYQISEELADETWNVVNGWNYLAKDTVGKQVIRSADSIGANIAEGSGRGTPIDNRRFLRMARGSLYETKHWFRRAFRRELLTPQQVKTLSALVEKLVPKLNACIRSVSQTVRQQSIQDQSSKPEVPIEET